MNIFEEIKVMKTGKAWYVQDWNIHPNSFEKLIKKKRSVQLTLYAPPLPTVVREALAMKLPLK